MKFTRRRSRHLAMQILFLWDAHGQSDPEMARQASAETDDHPIVREEALPIAQAAWDQREVADRWVERVAPEWPTHRQPPVDRNVLRLSVWELLNTQTPPKVVIDEAIEMAKHFSTQQAAAFVNAVMDKIVKEHQGITSSAPLQPTPPAPQPEP
jgi:transcription antitermination protein NusB